VAFARRDQLQAVLKPGPQPVDATAPNQSVEAGTLILEAEIAMAGRMRAAKTRDFTSHPHMTEGVFKRALECEGNLEDGEFRHVGLLGLAELASFGIMIHH